MTEERRPISWEALAAELAATREEAEERDGPGGADPATWDAIAAELAARVAERPAPVTEPAPVQEPEPLAPPVVAVPEPEPAPEPEPEPEIDTVETIEEYVPADRAPEPMAAQANGSRAGLSETAALLRELTSLGLDDDAEPSPRMPTPPTRPKDPPKEQPKKRKGLFGRG